MKTLTFPIEEDHRYTYAVARIRALETRLLEKSLFQRMVEAPSPEEVWNLLAQTRYSRWMEGKKKEEYEKVLLRENREALETFSLLTPEPRVREIFHLRHDFYNLKTILKSKMAGKPPPEGLFEGGIISLKKIKEQVEKGLYYRIPPPLGRAAAEAWRIWEGEKDLRAVEIFLDRMLYAEMYERAREIGDEFILGLIQIWIDLANIKNFLRAKAVGMEKELLEKILLSGGRVEVKFFLDLFPEPREIFVSRMSTGDYGKIVEEGFTYWKNQGAFWRLDKLSFDYVIQYLSPLKMVAFGPGPLVRYLLLVENELKNLRIIFLGKFNRIPSQALRERLGIIYA